MSGWKSIKDILEAASYIAVIFGILFAYVEYKRQISSWSKDRSFDFVGQFQGEWIGKKRMELSKPFGAYNLARFSAANPSKEDVDELIREIIESNPTILGDIVLVTEFLDAVHNCVKVNVCDGAVVHAQIGGYSRDFYCLFNSEIDRVKSQSMIANLGSDLQRYVAEGGGCSSAGTRKSPSL